MKKILTIIAIILTTNCQAFDTTMLNKKDTIPLSKKHCCKKHKTLLSRGIKVDSLKLANCVVDRKKKRKRIIKEIGVVIGCWTILVIIVGTGIFL